MDEKKSSMILLTGLWENTTKDGRQMFSGNLGGSRVIILANRKRETKAQPTHLLFIAENNRKPSEMKSETKSEPQTGAEALDEKDMWHEGDPF